LHGDFSEDLRRKAAQPLERVLAFLEDITPTGSATPAAQPGRGRRSQVLKYPGVPELAACQNFITAALTRGSCGPAKTCQVFGSGAAPRNAFPSSMGAQSLLPRTKRKAAFLLWCTYAISSTTAYCAT
jgi:hypothetical protein